MSDRKPPFPPRPTNWKSTYQSREQTPPKHENGMCCEKAKRRFCVCMKSWSCEIHGSVCIGTHD